MDKNLRKHVNVLVVGLVFIVLSTIISSVYGGLATLLIFTQVVQGSALSLVFLLALTAGGVYMIGWLVLWVAAKFKRG